MNITNYLRTNFSVDGDLLGYNSNHIRTSVQNYVILLNKKFSYKIPRIIYAVDYIGLNIVNSIEMLDHYTLLLENTPKSTVFLFTELAHLSKGGGFNIKPYLVGILSTEKIESLLNYEVVNDLGGSYHFYIKRTHVQ
jgi:hypothetical protein